MLNRSIIQYKKDKFNHFYTSSIIDMSLSPLQICIDLNLSITLTIIMNIEYIKNNFFLKGFRNNLYKCLDREIFNNDNILAYASEYEETSVNTIKNFKVSYNFFITIPIEISNNATKIRAFYIKNMNKLDNMAIFNNNGYAVHIFKG